MASETKKRRRIRTRTSRAILKLPFMRRFYARRMLALIDKSKEKRRPLPPELEEMSRVLSRVPKHMRLTTLEQALQPEAEELASRELRRAAARQQRQSGSRDGRRPGTVMSRQWQPPPAGTKPAQKRSSSARRKRSKAR